jgi:hypothetical protein
MWLQQTGVKCWAMQVQVTISTGLALVVVLGLKIPEYAATFHYRMPGNQANESITR